MVSLAEETDARAGNEPEALTESEIEQQKRKVRDAIDEPMRDSLTDLKPHMREALIDTVATHIALRHQKYGAGYLAHASNDDTHRWISPEDEHEWNRFKRWYEDAFDAPLDADTSVRQELQALAEYVQLHFGSRMVGVANDSEGARVLVAQGKTREDAATEFWRMMSRDEASFWMARYCAAAMPVRVPVRSLGEAVEQDGPATVARVHVLARAEGGHTVALFSEWYWDRRANAWANLEFSRRGMEREHAVGCWF